VILVPSQLASFDFSKMSWLYPRTVSTQLSIARSDELPNSNPTTYCALSPRSTQVVATEGAVIPLCLSPQSVSKVSAVLASLEQVARSLISAPSCEQDQCPVLALITPTYRTQNKRQRACACVKLSVDAEQMLTVLSKQLQKSCILIVRMYVDRVEGN
jgi:hypothetical protein